MPERFLFVVGTDARRRRAIVRHLQGRTALPLVSMAPRQALALAPAAWPVAVVVDPADADALRAAWAAAGRSVPVLAAGSAEVDGALEASLPASAP